MIAEIKDGLIDNESTNCIEFWHEGELLGEFSRNRPASYEAFRPWRADMLTLAAQKKNLPIATWKGQRCGVETRYFEKLASTAEGLCSNCAKNVGV